MDLPQDIPMTMFTMTNIIFPSLSLRTDTITLQASLSRKTRRRASKIVIYPRKTPMKDHNTTENAYTGFSELALCSHN